MCLPQKFVPVTQVGTGRLVPPLSPRGRSSMPGWDHLPDWCHPSICQIGATLQFVSDSGDWEAQISATRQSSGLWLPPQVGATRQFVTDRIGRESRNSESWGHPPVHGGPPNCATSQPFGQRPVVATPQSAGRPKAASQCHPQIRQPAVQDGATSGWCHPSVRSPRMVPPGSWSPAGRAAKPKTVPPVSSYRRQPGATRRFVSGRFGREARVPETVPAVSSDRREPGVTPQLGGANGCHPPVRLRQIRPGSPKQCHPAFRVPRWCHPSVCPR